MQDLSCSRKPVPASAIFRRCSLLPRLSVSVGMIHRPGGAAAAAAVAAAPAPPEPARRRDAGAAGNRGRPRRAGLSLSSLIASQLSEGPDEWLSGRDHVAPAPSGPDAIHVDGGHGERQAWGHRGKLGIMTRQNFLCGRHRSHCPPSYS